MPGPVSFSLSAACGSGYNALSYFSSTIPATMSPHPHHDNRLTLNLQQASNKVLSLLGVTLFMVSFHSSRTVAKDGVGIRSGVLL